MAVGENNKEQVLWSAVVLQTLKDCAQNYKSRKKHDLIVARMKRNEEPRGGEWDYHAKMLREARLELKQIHGDIKNSSFDAICEYAGCDPVVVRLYCARLLSGDIEPEAVTTGVASGGAGPIGWFIPRQKANNDPPGG